MTNEEMIKELSSDSLLNKVRMKLSNAIGFADQEARQRKPMTPVEFRHWEFQTAQEIIDIINSTGA